MNAGASGPGAAVPGTGGSAVACLLVAVRRSELATGVQRRQRDGNTALARAGGRAVRMGAALAQVAHGPPMARLRTESSEVAVITAIACRLQGL